MTAFNGDAFRAFIGAAAGSTNTNKATGGKRIQDDRGTSMFNVNQTGLADVFGLGEDVDMAALAAQSSRTQADQNLPWDIAGFAQTQSGQNAIESTLEFMALMDGIETPNTRPIANDNATAWNAINNIEALMNSEMGQRTFEGVNAFAAEFA